MSYEARSPNIHPASFICFPGDYPFAHVTTSDIEEAAPRNFKSLIDLSDNEIEIESE